MKRAPAKVVPMDFTKALVLKVAERRGAVPMMMTIATKRRMKPLFSKIRVSD